MSHNVEKSKLISFKLDPTKISYVGEITGVESEDMVLLFKTDLVTFYSTSQLVSHEGDADFTITFGRLDYPSQQFSAGLVLNFSFGELLKFTKLLEELKEKLPDNKMEKSKIVLKNEDVEPLTESYNMVILPNTINFSPNTYFSLTIDSGIIQLYFGRRVGQINKKPASIFHNSTIISHNSLDSLIETILRNIKTFEDKHNVKISDLVVSSLKEKLMKKSEEED